MGRGGNGRPQNGDGWGNATETEKEPLKRRSREKFLGREGQGVSGTSAPTKTGEKSEIDSKTVQLSVARGRMNHEREN